MIVFGSFLVTKRLKFMAYDRRSCGGIASTKYGLLLDFIGIEYFSSKWEKWLSSKSKPTDIA